MVNKDIYIYIYILQLRFYANEQTRHTWHALVFTDFCINILKKWGYGGPTPHPKKFGYAHWLILFATNYCIIDLRIRWLISSRRFPDILAEFRGARKKEVGKERKWGEELLQIYRRHCSHAFTVYTWGISSVIIIIIIYLFITPKQQKAPEQKGTHTIH